MEILSLGEKIKTRRKELNMTLKDLAKNRITPGQISLIESGRSNPSMDLLEYLASTLNISVEHLMESEESQAEKISIYYEQVAESYILSGNYEIGQRYIDNALYYSEKYNLEYRKARLLFITAQIHVYKRDFPMAQKFFLSSNVIFIKNNNYEEIIRTFLNLAKITIDLKAYHSAGSYLKQAEKVYLDNNIADDFLLGEIYYNMARTYFNIEDFDNALKYSYFSKNSLEKTYSNKTYAKTLLMLAEEFNKKGDLAKATQYSKKSLEVYRKIEYNKDLSNIEHNLGKLFYELDDLDESFVHYETSKKISTQNEMDNELDILIDMCKSHLKLKNIEECKTIVKKLNNLIDSNDNNRMIECKLMEYTLLNILEKHLEAEETLIEAYNIAKDNGDLLKAGELAMKIGKHFIDKKEEEQAQNYLEEGIMFFEKLGLIK
ncbi:helix-turn-helix domain-containing protein [Clostridium weizhouense]|uniref:Helix-turn-helix transcriptional regulator n=1 Tax=Clostridium weizhouense TaxID=2859781 RepID=A0ABS7AJ18_9CLOT|nr:helix-turn-helix transcriptional regulator [Clostridium weizhouense]MBW6408650.1 helix-turn-helix transcriptional regulator [Clostridium weizhouense]